MTGTCPHCGCSVGKPWHRSFGLEKIDKGWVEVGVPIVGRVNFRREAIAMVYVCEKTRLPFLVILKKAS
jgi:hypothetical protein